MMLAPVLLMLVIPRMMKNLDPESQKVFVIVYKTFIASSKCNDVILSNKLECYHS